MPVKTYQNRDRYLDTTGKIVGCYEREFYCFSNFSSFSLRWKGKLWPTSEHAYQASKFFRTAPALARRIAQAPSAHVAFKLAMANKKKYPADWDAHKADVMLDILRHKVRQHPYVAYKLMLTGRRTIVEDSFRDPVWGWGKDRKGQNLLGKLWMKVRDELHAKRRIA